MKFTGLVQEDELENLGMAEIVAIYGKPNEDKMAVSINPNFDMNKIMLGVYRINISLCKVLGMELDDFLKAIKSSSSLTEKTDKLDLTEEQLQKIIEKDLRGF